MCPDRPQKWVLRRSLHKTHTYKSGEKMKKGGFEQGKKD
jgi:hypothetical protein